MVKSDDKTTSAKMISICHVVIVIGAAVVDDDDIVIITRRAHSLPGLHITFYYTYISNNQSKKGSSSVNSPL